MTKTAEILKKLRAGHQLTQDELAQKLFVTRQAVSRWENGETEPGTDSLRLLSAVFGVSVNTLLGSPRALICQCCGMPMDDDSLLFQDKDGIFNEEYCKWCLTGNGYAYSSLEDLVTYLVAQFPMEGMEGEAARKMFRHQLAKLKHWSESKEQN